MKQTPINFGNDGRGAEGAFSSGNWGGAASTFAKASADGPPPYRVGAGKRVGAAGFTVLEMLVVITIIGLLAAVALPNLPGMTKANSMTVAMRQVMDEVTLARQLAANTRSTVYLVFMPTNFIGSNAPSNHTTAFLNLQNRQCTAYALVSTHTVGDQPGRPTSRYLTDWKVLPDGVIFPPFLYSTNQTLTNVIITTNTLSTSPNNTNVFVIKPLPTINFPFPSADATNGLGKSFTMALPCIGFAPNGQLTTNGDVYIPLAHGSVFYLPSADVHEAPPGNSTNNPNMIHLDWLTSRAKVERNQF